MPVALACASAQADSNDPDADVVVLEKIIVTATKREVPIESVPVSVLAIGGAELDQNVFTNLESLSAYVPNLVMGDGALTTAISIRGVGSQPERGFEQSVALFVDGVYMPRSRQYRTPFMDIQQLEIQRGPQAVLYGINATSGAITIATNRSRPGDAMVANVTAEYELEYGGPRITAVLGGSPTETLGLRLAVRYRDGGDYFLNEFSGNKEGGAKEKVLRLSGVWEPSTASNIEFTYEHGEFEFDGDYGEQFGPPELNQYNILGIPGTEDGQLNWVRNIDAEFYPTVTEPFGGRSTPGLTQDYNNLAITADFDIHQHKLTAILGYSDLTWDMYEDLDAGPLPIFVAAINEEFDQTSLELRWASPLESVFSYMLGFYTHQSDLSNDQPNIFEPTYSFAPGAYGFDEVYLNSSFATHSDLWSLFATANWNISDNVLLGGGVRYVDEEKKNRRENQCVPVTDGVINFNPGTAEQALFADNAGAFFCPTLDGYSGSRTDTNLMPEISIQWNINDSVMTYAKYSDSVKSGGFAAAIIVTEDSIEYQEEEAATFELGLRSLLAGGKGRLNLTLFNTEIDDLQLNAFDPISGRGRVTNAASARSRGIELDAGWQVNHYLLLNTGLAWLDAKYQSFPNAPCPISEALAGVVPPCDASGKTLPRAPKFSGSFSADFDYPLSSGVRLLAGLNLGYKDDYIVDAALESALSQEAYTLIGARVGLEAADSRWTLALVGTNLSNEAVLSDVLPFIANIGYLQNPRMIWLQGTYRFGAYR